MKYRALFLAALATWSAAAAGRELAGRVMDGGTGEPVARAHVTLHFYSGNQEGVDVPLLTDSDGSFRITNLPDSPFAIRCDKAGYLGSSQTMGQGNSGDGKFAPIVIRLVAQAVVEATVVDDKDVPAAYASVQLVRQQVVNGRRQLVQFSGGDTDETGHVRIAKIYAGRYYLTMKPTLVGARVKTLAYPPLFYPSATEVAEAQPIDLKAGDELQVRMRLPEPIPAYEIRGVVAGASPNVNIMIVRTPRGQYSSMANVATNWDPKTRSFRISHVTPGLYLLTAIVREDNNSLIASMAVTVGKEDVTGIHLEPVEVGVTGIVRVEAKSTVPAPYSVSFQAASFNAGAQIDSDGKFHFSSLLPEAYQVIAHANGPFLCMRSILKAGRDLRDGLVISADSSPAPIEIVMSDRCGTVDIQLSLPDSTPPGSLLVALLRKAGDEYVLENAGYSNVTGIAGATIPHILMKGIAPGDYRLYVWPQEAQVEYANAEYMRQFEEYGQTVTLTEDGTVSVTLDKILIPAKN